MLNPPKVSYLLIVINFYINQGDRDEDSTTNETVAKSDACRLHKVVLFSNSRLPEIVRIDHD